MGCVGTALSGRCQLVSAFIHAAIAFGRTRRLSRAWRTSQDVEQFRRRHLRRFLTEVAPKVPFYADARHLRLEDLPIMDKARVEAEFSRLNIAGVSFAEVRRALDAGYSTLGRYTIGQSTGTSGNRGVFLISEAERFTWLGVILAKTLPDVLIRRHRVAVALPGGRLYAAAAESGRLALQIFDPAAGVEAWAATLVDFAPDVLVAAPRTLRRLAELPGLRPRRVFSGSEVLDPLDRAALESAWNVRVREIYMATEGLFGVACPAGALHLAEDVVAFEWESATDDASLVKPLVTDFTRRTQVMARYRMNDLLALRAAPCACGSPLQAVEAVVGRADDVFLLETNEGAPVTATPDVVRNAVVDADRRIQDFRAVQEGPRCVVLAVAPDLAQDAADAARMALLRAFDRLRGVADVVIVRGLHSDPDGKLRRVRRAWSPRTEP